MKIKLLVTPTWNDGSAWNCFTEGSEDNPFNFGVVSGTEHDAIERGKRMALASLSHLPDVVEFVVIKKEPKPTRSRKRP